MKEKELRECADCSMCGRKIGESGIPMFWRVTVEHFGVDLRAIQRQQGLTMMLGNNAALAAEMGLDEDLAIPICEPVKLTICQTCCTEQTCVAALAELK